MANRREFFKRMLVLGCSLVFGREALAKGPVKRKVTKDVRCKIYRALNGRADENLLKVIEMIGGIENLIGSDDVVVIKPNVQWWNQGAPNLSSLNTFVDLIMHRSGGFNGEVVLAENCHRGSTPHKHAGWASLFERNSGINGIRNMLELSGHLKERYGKKFTTCHWIDVDAGNKRVFGPADGTGYVYCDGTGGVPLISCDNGCHGDDHRAVIMTYPIFKTDRNTIVDFKNGIWKNGAYTGQPFKFINFAALNHHSTYCGATSAVKNYLGISDLSGGPDPQNGGRLTGDYYNFHSFPFNKWAPGPESGMIGAEIGVFMNKIRKADLNITTAEWVGLASRVDPPVARTRAVLASKDAVALDYHATKYLLYPNSKVPLHNPDDRKSPLHQYLGKCAERGGGIFDEGQVAVMSYDFGSKSLQEDGNLVIVGEKHWGFDFKAIRKFLKLRYFKT